MIHFERLNKETEDLIIRVGESAIRYNRIIAAAPVQNPGGYTVCPKFFDVFPQIGNLEKFGNEVM